MTCLRLSFLMSLRSFGLLILLAACAEPGQLGPPAVVVFKIAAGNDQEGPTRGYAPLTLAVRAEDATAAPLAGLPVTWDNVVNGRVIPLSDTTSATGRAEALFIFGDTEGPAEVTARVPGAAAMRFQLRAAGVGSGVPYDALELLDFTTYEGSGETVHPDYARTPGFGFPQLLAITPYPGGDPSFENPSIFSGGTLLQWTIPTSVANPLARPSENSYLSDPDIVFVPETKEVWLYYRSVDSRNHIFVIRSGDGIHWGPPQEVASVPNHRLISPAVVYRRPGDWWMWSIDGGKGGCSDQTSSMEVRRSADGLHWGAPVPAPLANDGLTPWHVDVQWIPSRQEFWAVYNAKQPGSCATPALFLATSPEGVTWTPVRQPLVQKGVIPEFQDIIYRSTFRYDPGSNDLWLWISGASRGMQGWVWRTALQRRRASEALRAVPLRGMLHFSPPSAPLTDWP